MSARTMANARLKRLVLVALGAVAAVGPLARDAVASTPESNSRKDDSFGIECNVHIDPNTHSLTGDCGGDSLADVLTAGDLLYVEPFLSGNAENVLYRFNFYGLAPRQDFLAGNDRLKARDFDRQSPREARVRAGADGGSFAAGNWRGVKIARGFGLFSRPDRSSNARSNRRASSRSSPVEQGDQLFCHGIGTLGRIPTGAVATFQGKRLPIPGARPGQRRRQPAWVRCRRRWNVPP